MVSEERIKRALGEVLVPGVKLDLVRLNLFQGAKIEDKTVKVSLASTGLSEEAQKWIKARVEKVMGRLNGLEKAEVDFVERKPADLNQFGHIIAIMSGKGGVGKSLVAGLTAISLGRKGYKVGILDADLTGPSIPKMFGLTARPTGSNTGIMPVLSRSGIEVMSLNLLLPEEDEAVIWRGPVISSTIRQFWEGVIWGNLDYLIVDLPPGTSDAPLTVMQQLPLSGVVIVFTPQNLTTMIVRKAVRMAGTLEKPILGVVENMSYLYLPELDKRIELFGRSRADEMAQAANAPLLAQLPIDSELARLIDDGEIERYDVEVVNKLGEALIQSVEARAKKEKPAESE